MCVSLDTRSDTWTVSKGSSWRITSTSQWDKYIKTDRNHQVRFSEQMMAPNAQQIWGNYTPKLNMKKINQWDQWPIYFFSKEKKNFFYEIVFTIYTTPVKCNLVAEIMIIYNLWYMQRYLLNKINSSFSSACSKPWSSKLN